MAAVREKSNTRSRAGSIAATVITVLLVLAALAVYLFRDKLESDELRLVFGAEAVADVGDAYTYETGSGQMFAAAGNGLAVATTSGLQLLDRDGVTVTREVFTLGNPAVAACSKYAAVYDLGGTALRTADFEGNVTDLSAQGNIISVTVSGEGWMCVVSQESGYKGLVTVYDPSLNQVYAWHSGEGYVLTAKVAPGGGAMAAVTLSATGGAIHIFSLTSETQQAEYAAPQQLYLDVHWFSRDALAAIYEQGVLFLDSSCKSTGSYGFDGLYLADYELGGDGFMALLLSRYRTGNAGTLVTLGSEGGVLGQVDVQTDLSSLSARGSALLALYSDSLVLYSQKLSVLGHDEDILGVKRALLRDRSQAMLLSAYSEEIRGF